MDETNIDNKTVAELEAVLDRWIHTRDYLADSLEDCEATIADINERLSQCGVTRERSRRRKLADIGVRHGDLLEFVDFRKKTPVVLAEVPVINPYANRVRMGRRKMSYSEAARQLSGNKTAADPLAYFHWEGRRLRDWFDDLEAEDAFEN